MSRQTARFSNGINVRNMPIEIVSTSVSMFGHTTVEVNIGNIPAMIFDPNPCVTADGMVFLFSSDRKKGNWSKLISLTNCGETLEGFTDDPRLVKLAEMVFQYKIKELQVGTIIPPLDE
jgi:hypothetical protein